jgi:peptidyl-prolyl cis-trans isomerase SurA
MMTWVGIGYCIVFFMLVGCTSSKKKAEETALAIEKMNEQHQKYLQKQSSSQEKENKRPNGEVVDGIAARVNDDIILISDVDMFSRRLIKRAGSSLSANSLQTKMARKKVLERLIEMKLIEHRAKELGINIKDDEIQAKIATFKEQAGLTHEAFLAQLAKEGLTYREYIDQLKKEIEKIKVLEIEVKAKAQVSDEACKQFYDQNIEEYTKTARVRIQQILLLAEKRRLDKGEIAAIKKRIKKIRSEVINGADFGEMAKKFSEGPNRERGGDCGFFKKGDLMEEIERACFPLKVGETSPIVQTDIGFHLLRVSERENGNRTPFEAVKEDIRQELMKEAYMMRLKQWIQELKDRAFIDVRI